MKKFTHIASRAIPLPIHNIDTDQIIPAQYLRATSRKGFGEYVFANWRYTETGEPNPEFILNEPDRHGAQVLVTGENFGCGSSREHAPWALYEYGFRVIIAISFGDIFKTNAYKNNLLPIELEPAAVKYLMTATQADPTTIITIDLATQTVRCNDQQFSFAINPFSKTCLLNGVDDIGYTMGFIDDITKFEQVHNFSI